MKRQGPLAGLRILEFAGIGPTPFCGMLLSDLGADVVRIDRPEPGEEAPENVTARGRRSVALDLKAPMARDACLALARSADGLIEGFRPGVMERLGLGPEAMLARNPALVYGRMTGWGQTGPYAASAGHDLNYIAISGALHAIGTADKPIPPLNLVGDFGDGALYLAFGMVSAILHARQTGHGQIVDCAMVEGAASLMSVFYGLLSNGSWTDERPSNVLDGAAPYYDTYACRDGKWISIAAIEPPFYAELLSGLSLDPDHVPDRQDRTQWPQLRERLAGAIAQKTQAEWCEIFGNGDACFAPVRSLVEAPQDPQNQARQTFVEMAGVVQPAPLPRFSRSPGAIQGPPPAIGAHSRTALIDWGLPTDMVDSLVRSAVLRGETSASRESRPRRG